MIHNKYQLYIYSICVALAGFASACSDDSKNVENTLTCTDGLTICGHACCADTCCDGVCVDTKNDKNHCGACGNACTDGKVCMNNDCIANEEACKDGQEWCNGECVNTQNDAKHCGDCSTKCDTGESCQGGKCKAGCASGYTLVDDGKCVDTQRDSENCGEAGNVCGENSYCADGECACRNGYFDCDEDMTNGCESSVVCDYQCEAGQQLCSDSGTCCDAGTSCCGSSCCAEGTACCGADLCLDLSSDPHHCGDCNIACNTNQICESGECVDSGIACPAEDGVIVCWGNCVQSLQDKDNCGGCGHACDEGLACNEGKCTVACADDEAVCGDVCAKLDEDPLNCGACGIKCETTQVCTAIEEGYGCKEITEVNPEFVCENTTDPETGAEIAMTQCWSECVDLQTNADHCGECGKSCDEGFGCVAGACTKTCESGLNACGETCHDFQNDALACGNCETQCATTQTCVEGVCTDSELNCNEGANPEDPAYVEKTVCWGICTDLRTDVSNCGECGKQCEESQLCTEGVCTDKPADPTECDEASKCYGVCKDFMNDDANCGKCLNACGKGEKCIEGACIIQCGSLTACGKACVDTNSSKNNCGSCGVVCKDGQDCVGSACQCAEGRYDCDGVADNGCESTEICTCTPGTKQDCWRGLAENRGKGICKDGSQTCDASGQFWGACTGGTYPSAITCDEKGIYIGGDQNCNGVDDTQEECKTNCELLAGDMSYIGCEYWPVYLPFSKEALTRNYYIIISNPSTSVAANVYIYNKENYQKTPPQAYKTVKVDPNTVLPVELAAVGAGSSANVTGIHHTGYRVVSDSPITVYQFNPFPSTLSGTASMDASLLLPINTFGMKYIMMLWPSGDPNPSDMTVVASMPGKTKVTVTTNAKTVAGNGIAAMAAGETRTFELEQFDVLDLNSVNSFSEDFTGSLIVSDKKVAVYGSNPSTRLPKGIIAADHIEEQMFPTQSWGKNYNAIKTHPRGGETEIWRILAQEDNTKVTLSAPINLTLNLNARQFYELETSESFEINADKPILTGQFMVASSKVNQSVSDELRGDPSFILNVPYEQYRTDYAFMVPPGYAANYITIVTPSDNEIKIDGKAIDQSSYKAFGTHGFKYGYYSLGTVSGAHHLVASKPVGLFGYGFASYISYGYPIGLDLKVINTN